MSPKRIKNRQEILEASKDISIGDNLLVNQRRGFLEVVGEYQYYKEHSIDKFYILKGNGTKYLFAVYKESPPLLYTDSNFSMKEIDYTSGHGFTTKSESSERVRELFVSTPGYCQSCSCTKLYDSDEDEFYCPLCEI